MQKSERDILDVKRKSGFRDHDFDVNDATVKMLRTAEQNLTSEKTAEFKVRISSLYRNFTLEKAAYVPSKIYVPRKKKDRPKKLQTIVSHELEHLKNLVSTGNLKSKDLQNLHEATIDLIRAEGSEYSGKAIRWKELVQDRDSMQELIKQAVKTLDVPRRSSRDLAPEYTVVHGLGQLYFDITGKIPTRNHDHKIGETGTFLSFVRCFFDAAGYPVHGQYSAMVRRYIETDAQSLTRGVKQP